MKNFRLVILDYALKQKEKPAAQKLLNDLIFIKQSNFERTDPDYVVMDKHDMIGTHFLIFETSDIYSPRLIYGTRVTYSSRAKNHKIKTPLQDLHPYLSTEAQTELSEFTVRNPELIEVNSLFVEDGLSARKSNMHFSDIGFAMIYLHLARMGLGHFAGCANEKYKAHRLVKEIGFLKNNRGYLFDHPVVRFPHMLVMIEKFNVDYLNGVIQKHLNLFENMMDVSPAELNLQSIPEIVNYSLQSGELQRFG